NRTARKKRLMRSVMMDGRPAALKVPVTGGSSRSPTHKLFLQAGREAAAQLRRDHVDMPFTIEQIRAAVAGVADPVLGGALAVRDKDIAVDGDAVAVTVDLGYPARSLAPALSARIEAALRGIGVPAPRVTVQGTVRTHAVQRGLQPLPRVRNIIAVASGKG